MIRERGRDGKRNAGHPPAAYTYDTLNRLTSLTLPGSGVIELADDPDRDLMNVEALKVRDPAAPLIVCGARPRYFVIDDHSSRNIVAIAEIS